MRHHYSYEVIGEQSGTVWGNLCFESFKKLPLDERYTRLHNLLKESELLRALNTAGIVEQEALYIVETADHRITRAA